MTELEAAKNFENIEVYGTEQDEYDDGDFENDVDISEDYLPARGRGRGAFRLALP